MTHSTTARRLLAGVTLAVLAACQDAPAPTAPRPTDPNLSAVPGQDRREAAFQRISPDVMAIPGTVFADNDERVGKLVFGVEHMGAVGAVRAALARHGISEAEYAIELTPRIEFKATVRDVFRPTIAGIQIHFSQYLCTMGFNVDHAGGRSFITNSHCTARQGGTEGTVYYQPLSSTNGTVIATEADDPPYVKGGSCPKGKKCRWSDASRALYSSGTASNRGEIAQTTGANNGSLTLSSASPVFTITSQNNTTTNYAVGTVVNKVGRTTGWTRGQVTRTCVNTGVSGSQVYLYCQTFVSDPAGATVVDHGDSGSPVFATTSGSNVQLLGILWGGSSDNRTFIFSPLASIQRELGSVNAVK